MPILPNGAIFGSLFDGKGRYLENIFIERLWRSLKYEEIYLKTYTSVATARRNTLLFARAVFVENVMLLAS